MVGQTPQLRAMVILLPPIAGVPNLHFGKRITTVSKVSNVALRRITGCVGPAPPGPYFVARLRTLTSVAEVAALMATLNINEEDDLLELCARNIAARTAVLALTRPPGHPFDQQPRLPLNQVQHQAGGGQQPNQAIGQQQPQMAAGQANLPYPVAPLHQPQAAAGVAPGAGQQPNPGIVQQQPQLPAAQVLGAGQQQPQLPAAQALGAGQQQPQLPAAQALGAGQQQPQLPAPQALGVGQQQPQLPAPQALGVGQQQPQLPAAQALGVGQQQPQLPAAQAFGAGQQQPQLPAGYQANIPQQPVFQQPQQGGGHQAYLPQQVGAPYYQAYQAAPYQQPPHHHQYQPHVAAALASGGVDGQPALHQGFGAQQGYHYPQGAAAFVPDVPMAQPVGFAPYIAAAVPLPPYGAPPPQYGVQVGGFHPGIAVISQPDHQLGVNQGAMPPPPGASGQVGSGPFQGAGGLSRMDMDLHSQIRYQLDFYRKDLLPAYDSGFRDGNPPQPSFQAVLSVVQSAVQDPTLRSQMLAFLTARLDKALTQSQAGASQSSGTSLSNLRLVAQANHHVNKDDWSAKLSSTGVQTLALGYLKSVKLSWFRFKSSPADFPATADDLDHALTSFGEACNTELAKQRVNLPSLQAFLANVTATGWAVKSDLKVKGILEFLPMCIHTLTRHAETRLSEESTKATKPGGYPATFDDSPESLQAIMTR